MKEFLTSDQVGQMDKLFEKAKSVYGSGAYDDATLKFLFPQLTECKDERIRKHIVEILERLTPSHFDGVDKRVCLSWLENHKEHTKSMGEDLLVSRIPTIGEWKWLINNCKWEWDDKRNGQVVTALNGNSIFLPFNGISCDVENYSFGEFGYCWSSTIDASYTDRAQIIYFGSSIHALSTSYRQVGASVRLVSDTPQKGYVDMGNGLYWKNKNEEGYYTYDEAINYFSEKREYIQK